MVDEGYYEAEGTVYGILNNDNAYIPKADRKKTFSVTSGGATRYTGKTRNDCAKWVTAKTGKKVVFAR
jgi:hypothetical protein